ncbi:MAG: hypothetical protein R6X25_14920 [Candidatus Krumholzibacteriia bacterium]
MNPTRRHLSAMAAIALLTLAVGCSERDPAELEVARARIDPLVFDDDYGEDVYFQAFSGTYLEAVSLDSVYAYSGQRSLKITVPPEGSALGAYAGGVLTAVAARDLADFNALTFYARSSVNSVLNLAGFGNDNTGTSPHEAARSNIPLTTDWTFVVVPIPAPGKLVAERGLFTFAEGWEAQHPLGHQVWFDEIRFARLGNITDPRPVMPSTSKQYFVGTTASLAGTRTTFDVDGARVAVDHLPGYFDFHSTDPTVATVQRGAVRIVGEGDAVITATSGGIEVQGAVTLSGYRPPAGPAPAPTLPPGRVISMFSDVYQDVPVDSWNTRWQWSTAEDSDYKVDGDDTRMYANLNFVGIEFTTGTIDASAMTHLHLDVYAPVGTNFRVKIVAFNGDGGVVVGESEVTLDAGTTPAFVAGTWSSLDIPLDDFQFTVPLTHVGQLVLSTDDARLVLLDNLYWHE